MKLSTVMRALDGIESSNPENFQFVPPEVLKFFETAGASYHLDHMLRACFFLFGTESTISEPKFRKLFSPVLGPMYSPFDYCLACIYKNGLGSDVGKVLSVLHALYRNR